MRHVVGSFILENENEGGSTPLHTQNGIDAFFLEIVQT